MSFGYKTAWIAVHSTDTDRVMRAMGIRDAKPCDGDAGMEAAYETGGSVFVTSPLDGWTLVASQALFRLSDGEPPSFGEFISRLSAELGCDVQFFSTHRVVEAHFWGQAVGGTLRRAYGYVGESGAVATDFGEKTPAEVELNFAFFDDSSPEAESEGYWEREDLRFPDEQDVTSLAGLWSVSPSTLVAAPDGLVGELSDLGQWPAQRAKPWWRFW
jgi:hypothetical protein